MLININKYKNCLSLRSYFNNSDALLFSGFDLSDFSYYTFLLVRMNKLLRNINIYPAIIGEGFLLNEGKNNKE